MIKNKIACYTPQSLGGGDYGITIYFSDSTKAPYLNLNDIITDSMLNRYVVILGSGDFTTTIPFSDGAALTVHYLTTDILPQEDPANYDSVIDTPNAFDPDPALRTTGTLYDVQQYDPSKYEYALRMAPDYTPFSDNAQVGDSLVDGSGKEFIISFLPTPEKFTEFGDPFRVTEAEPQGISPMQAPATLYRATLSHSFFQGSGNYLGDGLTDIPRTNIQDRDFKKLDSLLGAGGGGGLTGIQGETGIGIQGETGIGFTGIQGVTGPSGGGGGSDILGLPTDGMYGVTGIGAIAGVAEGDKIEDAFDKIETVLAKLAPPKPANLSAKTLSVSGTYSALESSTGTVHSIVTDVTTPTSTTSTSFYDGDAGTLSAKINGSVAGSRVLTTGDDTGSYSSLKITSDLDPYLGQTGKEGFWRALIAGVEASSPLSVGLNTYQLLHSTTGNTPVYTLYVDDPATPSISSYSITSSGTGTYISGVPSLAAGNTVQANFTVGNAIKSHYNSTRIASANSSVTNSANAALPVSPPISGATFVASINLSVSSSSYIENVVVSCLGYNSKGGTASQNVSVLSGTMRVDTVSNETIRKKSGTSTYPTKGSSASQFGDTYVSATSLVSNEELQLLNGSYQYPSANYLSNTPVGPNYSSLTGIRWVTFNNIGSITAASSLTFTFNGSVNFGGTAEVSNFYLYVLIDGAVPTAGWVDGNKPYDGVSSPSVNGDYALVVANSTATSKKITFGQTPRTGTIWVRVGFPSGSDKKFTGIS